MKNQAALITFCTFLVIVLSTPAEAQGLDEEQARTIVAELNSSWVEAFRAGDAKRLADLFLDEGVRLPNGLPKAAGKEELERQYQAELDALGEASLDAEVTIEEVIVTDDIIVARGDSFTELNRRNTVEPIIAKGKWIAVVQQDPNGEWKYRWSTFNETRE